MRYLVEIFLTACEWIEERRGKRWARRVREQTQKKTILTFLSQGAVGGAIGYFIFAIYTIVSSPSGYNFVFLVALPIWIACGMALGSFTAVFIWLPGALLKRRLGFANRAVLASGGVVLLSLAISELTGEFREERWSSLKIMGLIFVISLPIALVTGSRVRPGRMIIFGVGPRARHHNFGSWLSYPAGFLLRTLSIVGLLETLTMMALWVSNESVDREWFPQREHLPPIIFAFLYFAASAYFSINTPRKLFLVSTAIALNLPLAALIVYLRGGGTADSTFLSYSFIVFTCLWAIYTLGRMITPESTPCVVSSLSIVGNKQKVFA